MRFRYWDATTGEDLDVVNMTAAKTTYKTGKARGMVENALARPGGFTVAAQRFSSWSNGYVATTELPE